MRPIDADELKKIREDYIQGKLNFQGNEYDMIDLCQTLEVTPVRHGQWENYPGHAYRRCSLCKILIL